jgi:hypothetical protein
MLPYGRQRVSYTVKAPEGISGSYYAALFFETDLAKPPEGGEGVGAGINFAVRIASLFFVEAQGTALRQGELSNLSVVKSPDSGGLNITLDFKNTGNTDIFCGGSYHIMNDEGIIFARGEFNDAYTFPNESAKLEAKWKNLLPKGSYIIVFTLDLGKAQEEAGTGRGPVITKEAEISIGDAGEVLSVGRLQ